MVSAAFSYHFCYRSALANGLSSIFIPFLLSERYVDKRDSSAGEPASERHDDRQNRVKSERKHCRLTRKDATAWQKQPQATEIDTDTGGNVSEMRPETEGKGSEP